MCTFSWRNIGPSIAKGGTRARRGAPGSPASVPRGGRPVGTGGGSGGGEGASNIQPRSRQSWPGPGWPSFDDPSRKAPPWMLVTVTLGRNDGVPQVVPCRWVTTLTYWVLCVVKTQQSWADIHPRRPFDRPALFTPRAEACCMSSWRRGKRMIKL